MVNIELMSDNLTLILDELINNQTIVKYLSYNEKNPLSKPDITLPAKSLILSKVHPYPFDPTATTQDSCEIRVYYPHAQFDGSDTVTNTFIYIDIVCARSLWLVSDDKAAIRPYMLASAIHRHFKDRSIGTIGKLRFNAFQHLAVNTKFDAIRLEVDMSLFSG